MAAAVPRARRRLSPAAVNASRGAPVRASLAAAVAEIERVAASADGLQLALSPLLRRAGEAVETLQALDEITQHLHGLATYLGAVAADCPPDWRLDTAEAAGLLRLHSQKLRLGVGQPPSDPPLAPKSGELELW